MTAHAYISTACHHEYHPRCRMTCKFCGIPCMCSCHGSSSNQLRPTPAVAESLVEAASRISLTTGLAFDQTLDALRDVSSWRKA